VKHIVLTTITLLTTVLLSACATVTPQQTGQEIIPVNSIAILPTEILIENNRILETVRQRREAGAAILNTLLTDRFSDMPSMKLVRQGQLESLQPGAARNKTLLAREIGRQLQVDAVFTATVNRYRPRDGTSYSVNRPASVSFDYRLIDVDTGQTLCSGVFDETQQSLSENMFSFSQATKRGFRWITAEELLTEGLQDKLDNCIYLQSSQK
jgi:hypothetical protein